MTSSINLDTPLTTAQLAHICTTFFGMFADLPDLLINLYDLPEMELRGIRRRKSAPK